ncbi:WD40 repeat-like protein [Schizophyllum commune H4-8]|uniref:WD40 repeat-like protein n=1 Tax=Schizophyllum commune (strain H4-8 / FGSC 9210) TaxID=578458 RepID=UPI002160563A|nr:WD40 repeat-like protein [Schizophyllum commune H4-8]KAI5891990.1 WD40 repeat-like protein [Schizophyllum commune H4-8]
MQQAFFRVEDMVEKLEIDNALRHLPVATVHAGSTRACLPGTRVEILGLIVDWIFDPKGSRGFILHGTAGKGKSAVAHTVARWLTDAGVATSFFAFERTNRARRANQLLPTLARQLAYLDPQYYRILRSLLPAQMETTDIHDQSEHLILSAFRDYAPILPIVFVIDALDECPNIDVNEIEDRKALLNSLRTCMSDVQLHYNIRIFITTRPERETYYPLLEDSVTFIWKSIDSAAGTAGDIRKFVESELMSSTVRKIVGDLSNAVDIIANAAQDSFECAAVLCRELTGPQRPKTGAKREELIRRVQAQPGFSLYASYGTILEEHLDTDDDDLMNLYRQTVGWVFAVREPQPRSVFQEIADTLPSRKDILLVLEGLGSLLSGTSPSDTKPIRPLHTSFRDFVLDAEASGNFAITSEFAAADSQLALACFSIIDRPKSGLRYNICDLLYPFVYKWDIDDLDGRLTEHISPGLQYACREVTAHLSHSQPGDSDLIPALTKFLQNQFLFWLEACGWLGYEPCDSLRNMLHWVKLNQGDLAAIVTEFIAFEKRFREAMSESPPQVYVTGLLFAPDSSHVSRLYRHRIVNPIDISGYQREQGWPPSETLVIQAGSSVYSVAYSPDGAKIVAGLRNHELRIWDAETGRQIGSAMRGHEDQVLSVTFSPDGSTIASGSWDFTVLLWDAKTGKQQGEALRGHTDCVRSVAFSPDGTTVVSASDDCTLRLWDAKAGKEIGESMEGHTRGVNSVVFSHDGARIVSGADDCTVRIWETATRQQLGDSIRHNDWVRSVSISRGGKYVASGSDDGTVRVWDARGRKQVWASHGHTGWVFSVAFSPDSTRIVSGGRDATVRIWDVASGAQVGDDLRGHADDVNFVAFSPDGKHVASSSSDRTIRVWDVREAKKESGIPIGHTGKVYSVACSPDGKYIVSGSDDQTVRLCYAQTGQLVGDPMTGHDDKVSCVTFSPDSTRIASASGYWLGHCDGTVRVWDAETRLSVRVLQGHYRGALCVAFSPDGTRLVSGSADKTLRLWDLATGQQIGEPLYGHKDYVQSVSFSSDGLYIASGSNDSSIRLWDAESRLQRRGALEGHQKSVQSLAFSPDDLYLVSGSLDRTIRLWDVKTGEQMRGPLTGHTDWVRSVSFSPDGKYVVSGSDDRTVRVWSVQTRQQVGVSLRGHKNLVSSVTFSFDGSHIVSGSFDGTIRVWDFGKLQSWENRVDAASGDTIRARVQASLQKNDDCWLVYDDNGTERPILWIPHHLRRIHRAYSPFHVKFVPPTMPHLRITLGDSFRLGEWPSYTSAPAPEELSMALEMKE